MCVIKNLNGEEMFGTFYENELQKKKKKKKKKNQSLELEK